ncbi:MAG: alpha/beta hydrolase [Pseudomonadota bacterium]
MSRPKVFLHGVPDTPAIWTPVIDKLGLPSETVHTPAMPGFGVDIPNEFDCTKEAYVDWFLDYVSALHDEHGPVDVIGHDWGALITVRAVSLRPDLFATWTISNAAPHVDYRWHRMAKLWQTPLVGELIQMLTRPKALAKALAEQGLPMDLVKHEAAAFDGRMKRAILKLYRSARNASREWVSGVDQMHDRGLVFWGEQDPYVPHWVGTAFAERTDARMVSLPDAAHWSIIEKTDQLASELKTLWADV